MHIRYYGHSCFLLTIAKGKRILIDPCSPETGYTLQNIKADVMTISQDRFDHNYVQAAAAPLPIIVRTPGVHDVAGVRITGIETGCEEGQEAPCAPNIIFLYEIEGMRVVHMGGLQALPNEEVLKAIGQVHVLFVPIGGTYTITPTAACRIANITKTNVLIPMCYQTPKLTLEKPLLEVEHLLSIAKDCNMHKLNQSDCTITAANLGEDRILVLDAKA